MSRLQPEALVLLSGGMDSVMALLWARDWWACEAVSVHYGQRHHSELAAAWDIAESLRVPLESVEVSAFASVAPSGLTGRPRDSVVVPMRNAFLLSIAGAVAVSRGIERIIVGFNADDEAGFPDCRQGFLDAMESTLQAASERPMTIIAPWIRKSKGEALSAFTSDAFAMETIRRSVSCYEGRTPGCGACSACTKRSVAFAFVGERE